MGWEHDTCKLAEYTVRSIMEGRKRSGQSLNFTVPVYMRQMSVPGSTFSMRSKRFPATAKQLLSVVGNKHSQRTKRTPRLKTFAVTVA